MILNLVLSSQFESAVSPISNNDTGLFQFGNFADDLVGPRFDDSSSDPLTLTTPFTFFGRQYNHIIVS